VAETVTDVVLVTGLVLTVKAAFSIRSGILRVGNGGTDP
jgi:hypothetical protein